MGATYVAVEHGKRRERRGEVGEPVARGESRIGVEESGGQRVVAVALEHAPRAVPGVLGEPHHAHGMPHHHPSSLKGGLVRRRAGRPAGVEEGLVYVLELAVERQPASGLLGEQSSQLGSERLPVLVELYEVIAEVHRIRTAAPDTVNLLAQKVEERPQHVVADLAEALQYAGGRVEGEVRDGERGAAASRPVGLIEQQTVEA